MLLNSPSLLAEASFKMRDGQGCLLPVLAQYVLPPEDHPYMPNTCPIADVPAQLPQRRSRTSEKRKKPRRVKIKCIVGTQQIDPELGSNCTESAQIDFSAQMEKMTSLQNGGYQNEDPTLLPGLDDETALRCLAFVSRSDHGRLAMSARKYLQLVRSPLLFTLRRFYGIVEPWVYMFTNGTSRWTAFDPFRNIWMSLPPTNADPNFDLSDRESLSAGTHLLWLGKEAFDFACYRYDLVTNSWEKGPPMVNPRCLFASASCGEFAFVAGGFCASGLTVLNSAERYDSRSSRWDPLPPMNIPRQKCSGFYMDGKFFVIGGKDRNHQPVTSGEEYNDATRSWRLIDNMYPGSVQVGPFEPSPPLVAVANNQLYAIESPTNLLKVYLKNTNAWKILGPVPVRADFRNGWGLAFKALGDALFVIGGCQDQDSEDIAVFSWRPGPDATAPEWQIVTSRVRGAGNFLFNCAVMAC